MNLFSVSILLSRTGNQNLVSYCIKKPLFLLMTVTVTDSKSKCQDKYKN